MRAHNILICACLLSAIVAGLAENQEIVTECAKNANGDVCGGSANGECKFRTETTTAEKTLVTGVTVEYKITHKTGYCECKVAGLIGNNQPCIAGASKNEERKSLVKAMLSRKTGCESNTNGQTTHCPVEAWVAVAMQGKCVAHMRECFGGEASLILAWRGAQENNEAQCGSGKRYCANDGSCIPDEADCSTCQSRCDSSTPVRCSDGSCATSMEQCPSDETSCSNGQVLCADGLTCRNSHFECALRLSYNGCEADMIECPQNPKVCGKNMTHCQQLTGCPDSQEACGADVSLSTGSPLFTASGSISARCTGTCARKEFKSAVQKSLTLVGNTRQQTFEASGSVLLGLRIESGTTVQVVGASANSSVNFVVNSVPDSSLRWGAYGELWAQGRIYGTPISITPEAELEMKAEGGGTQGSMSVCMAMAENSDIDNQAACSSFTASFEMYSCDNHNRVEAEVEYVGPCKAEYSNGVCQCCASAKHFSTFAVAASGGAASDSDVLADTESAAVSLASLSLCTIVLSMIVTLRTI